MESGASRVRHPELLDVLNIEWVPAETELIGYWAAERALAMTVLAGDARQIVAGGTRSSGVLAALEQLNVTASLVVPMWSEGRDAVRSVEGAITFMSTRPEPAFMTEEVAFVESVAYACGRALRNSRLFNVANGRRVVAEREHRATTDMLGHVTHELRTPLAAIGGYVEIVERGIHGAVSNSQRQDLQRIRWNQRHL